MPRPRVTSRSSSTHSQTAGIEVGAWQWHEDGLRTGWDGLRKDIDLFEPSGDCLVYLYDRGASRRPAAIQISTRLIHEAQCSPLLALIESPYTSEQESESDGPSRAATGRVELYIGAPKDLSRVDTFRWHIATRNFFAWLLQKPLVGPYLGQAMNDLLDRMTLYRDSDVDNLADLLAYAADMSYTSVAHRPEYAAAMLIFADHQRLRDTWIDAFSHCVGMSDALEQAPDYPALNNALRALITKVALQLDLDLEAKSRAISSLLEDDLSASRLGLTANNRAHLDSFRSFLQGYLVKTYGYWPPRSARFAKELYSSLHEDFESLVFFLADINTAQRPALRHSTSGGICVLQNLAAFDERHGFEPLPTTLPLLPQIERVTRRSSMSLKSILSTKTQKSQALTQSRAAHLGASNTHDLRLRNNTLVQAFIEFEASAVSAGESQAYHEDARKVRWIFTYELLQMLRAVLRSPKEAQHADEVDYPLCCDVAGLPTWRRTRPTLARPRSVLHSAPSSARTSPTHGSVRPDGETDYVSYFNGSTRFGDSNTHPALRRLVTGRPKSHTRSHSTQNVLPARPNRNSLVRTLSRVSLPSTFMLPTRPISDTSDGTLEDGVTTPDSTKVPSLDWSSESRSPSSPTSDTSSNEELARPASSSSSIYSSHEVALDAAGQTSLSSTPLELVSPPRLPQKSLYRNDVLDKGLANDDFICPGLAF